MADLDLDAIGTVAIVWRANGADGTADAIEALVAEVRRLRAIEDAARLADANLHNIAAVGLDECMEAWDVLHDALEADRG